ncbi:hypothetical protein CY34DRAFT_804245 [Suillus luteus UH-Slu-Lm8-n1]|uniref:Uncharacterized protein n=1 Tax=Suillus luteus UH-Slu-Lm8-n1 TaxID=930992 RepID=A0A0D0AZA5_9AGAM|nr:hypothetical protein CY34DRAFT_804245 [Suillus luteus UH-Slu-Lm8-n1]
MASASSAFLSLFQMNWRNPRVYKLPASSNFDNLALNTIISTIALSNSCQAQSVACFILKPHGNEGGIKSSRLLALL